MKKNLTNLITTPTNLLTALFGARTAFAAAFAVLICLFAAAQSNAATYTVTTNLDLGPGSLRQAVLDANATGENDTIAFNIPSALCHPTTGVCTITLASEIVIANNGSLTINGLGANRLTIDGGAGTNRIFSATNATFTLSGATLTGGNGTGATASNYGGAIYVSGGAAALNGVYVTGNTTAGGATDGGAGADFENGGTHQILNSTFAFNQANGGSCGAIFNRTGTTLTITNTTIHSNAGITFGGGICNNGSLTIRSSTITGNTATNSVGGNGGGGIFTNGTLSLTNTIIAGNNHPNFPEINNYTTVTSSGYNLVGDSAGDSTATGTAITYQSTDIQNTPPLLATLANYGGTVPTRQLSATSPAIDNGNSALSGTPALDARGVVRPFDIFGTANAAGGNGADIGAFELQTSIVKDWGQNNIGQLGLGFTGDRFTPTLLTGFNNITAFNGGFQHSAALLSDGTVVTAGDDIFGQLGDGTIGGGNRTTFGAVTGGSVVNITQISAGYQHTIALRSDGTVWAWGRGTEGQLGNGASANSATPVQVGAGNPSFNGRVVGISATNHNLALTDDGKVWSWGNNSSGQLGDGTQTNSNAPIAVKASSGGAQLSGVVQVSAGGNHSVALKTDGTVVVWGNNTDGEVGNGMSGGNVSYPAQTVNTLMGTVVQISAGEAHNVAVNTAGDVYAWGFGGIGSIGDGNTADALVPRKTSTIANVVRIEANGASHNLARQRDGTMFAWGYGGNGTIGNGTNANQLTPLNISAPAGTGGNLGTNIAVFGVGNIFSFASTVPEAATPAGASTLRGDYFSVAFPASTTAGTTQIRTFDPTATGLTVPSGYTIEANSTGYDITSSAQFSGNAQVCLKISNEIDQTTFNKLTILHDDNFDGTFDVVTVTRNYQKREVCRVTQSFSPFVLAQALVPLAATVSVSGKITVNGAGLRNAVVQLTDSQGSTRTTLSSSFGYFRFDSVEVGQTYTVSVASKRFTFAPQIVAPLDEITDLDFSAIQ